jgi:hypothetical protein
MSFTKSFCHIAWVAVYCSVCVYLLTILSLACIRRCQTYDTRLITHPPSWVTRAYSAQSDHLFRSIPITCSASFRSPVPILSDHRIVIFSGRLRVAGDTGMSIMILIV